MYPRFKQPAADVSAPPRFPKGRTVNKTTTEPDAKAAYKALAEELANAEAAYAELGAKVADLRQRAQAAGAHYSRIANSK